MQSTQKPVIGIDLDDVLFDFMEPLIGWHNTMYSTSHTREEYNDFALHRIWNCEKQEAIDRVGKYYVSEEYKNAMPISGAYENLQSLKDRYSFVIVTARPETVKPETDIWLAKHFPDFFDAVHYTNRFHNTEKKRLKSAVCKEVGIQLFIDDSIHNAKDIASIGIPVLLFNKQWNQEAVLEGITRVHSWEEIREKIQEI